MRLAEADETPAARLEDRAGQVLDRRLLRATSQPLAVALSGGGDSLALLLSAADWARAAGRGLIVLTVDHGLRPQSADWTATCAATAGRLGFPFRGLAWIGEKPATGLPAAARAARHTLLAEAARAAGARVILMGHTADDILEARRMRADGSSTPDPREWSPSPAWPQGRGVFLLRPLLGLRRAELRAWLTGRGECWIDDPANEDTGFARPRARQAVAGDRSLPAAPDLPSAKALAQASRPTSDGGFEIARAELRAAAPEALLRFVSAACLCAAGAARPPRRGRVERLAARLRDATSFVASLAGARVEADAGEVRFVREAGEIARGGLAPIRLGAGQAAVWDGRFEVTAQQAGEVRAAPGATTPDVAGARALTWDRLMAACGAIEREPSAAPGQPSGLD